MKKKNTYIIKKNKKLKSIVEIFNFNEFFYNYNNIKGYILENNNIFIHDLNNTIKEKKEQKQYFLDTGNNFFMVIVRLERIDVHKNGTYDHTLSTSAVEVYEDETIDLKYIKGLKDDDFVEFYFDD